ncbi:MAG: DUF402 domain-containing protein [Mycoplasmataceae bacterium]|jgi:protein associated with RNAse G/E|nr:DUF402 domain-containing protein [Mycoplasmataceae bacterium]
MSNTKKVSVHAYKFNGLLYRSWEFPTIIENTDKYMCIDIRKSKVIFWKKTDQKHVYSTIKNQSFWYFPKNEWFNFIVATKSQKPYIYVNVSSPFIYEEDTIKFIDLDIDFKTLDVTSKEWKKLDEDEFSEHSIEYNYPQALINKINAVSEQLQTMIDNGYFNKYADVLKDENE